MSSEPQTEAVGAEAVVPLQPPAPTGPAQAVSQPTPIKMSHRCSACGHVEDTYFALAAVLKPMPAPSLVQSAVPESVAQVLRMRGGR